MSSSGKKKAKRSKTWFQIYAADVFPGQWLGETLASDQDSLIGRNVEVSVRDITGDFAHEKYKLVFKIFRVDGSKSYARFVKELLNRDYLRSIIQRRTSRIDVMSEGITEDGHHVRVFYLITTAVRVRHSQETAIRLRAKQYLDELIPQLSLEELVRSSIFEDPAKINTNIQGLSTKIAPVKNIEPRKIVVLRFGEALPEVVRGEVESRSVSSGKGEEA